MPQGIRTIHLSLPYKMGSVNCYLLETNSGYILIDTGCSSKRSDLEKELENAGCKPGNLNLIMLTHGDFDHTGNAAYIKKKYHTIIGMHPEDSPIVEHGNMFLNRKRGNFFQSWVVKTLFGFGKSQRFKPDLKITDGFDLIEYGLKAKVIHIPGHSKGSIGILTTDGKLICGDLLENTDNVDNPKINSLMDDLETANGSIETLKKLKVDIVYPGHGKPFTINSFLNGLNK